MNKLLGNLTGARADPFALTIFWGDEVISSATGTDPSLTHRYTTPGLHTIYVFAITADGMGYFAGTREVTVDDTPAAPSGLSAGAVSGHQIDLGWANNSAFGEN